MKALALFLRQVAFLAQKEMLSLLTDPRMRVQLVMPVIIMGFLFGYAANYNIEDIPYAVVDASHTAASDAFLAEIEGSPAFRCVAATGNIEAAKFVGKLVAERALEKGIQAVVFDRGGHMFHGRVKALADSAREAGLKF